MGLGTAFAILRFADATLEFLLKIGRMIEDGRHEDAIAEIERNRKLGTAAGNASYSASRSAGSGSR